VSVTEARPPAYTCAHLSGKRHVKISLYLRYYLLTRTGIKNAISLTKLIQKIEQVIGGEFIDIKGDFVDFGACAGYCKIPRGWMVGNDFDSKYRENDDRFLDSVFWS